MFRVASTNKHIYFNYLLIIIFSSTAVCLAMATYFIIQLLLHYSWCPGGGGVEILWISSDRDDQRIFLGLEFSILGFFWVGKFGKYFFGSLI